MQNNSHSPSARASPPSKKAKTKFPKIFQCTGYGDCKMTFTRSEHLARHIRKHTGERPFRCHCNRTFSRLDNLRQHIQTVHANEHHILHAPPPPPLPHSNKVDQQQQQHHEQHQLYQPPAFNPKHRPAPIALPTEPVESPRHSPSSPYQHNTQLRTSNSFYGTTGQYPPQQPATPQLHSYRSTTALSTSSVSSSRHPSSNLSTPVSTNSWLSSVLCDNTPSHGGEPLPPVEERPHTWGPSNNRYSSTSTYDEHASSDRNSLSQLVRITEDAHISTPPHQAAADGALPPLSSVLTNNDVRPPQLSANRSYTKDLILPRPDSYPPPKNYMLPMADTRPPALPPAGQEVKYSPAQVDKPLPPLPAEAQQQHAQQQQQNTSNGQKEGKDQKDGMDVLLQAAGV